MKTEHCGSVPQLVVTDLQVGSDGVAQPGAAFFGRRSGVCPYVSNNQGQHLLDKEKKKEVPSQKQSYWVPALSSREIKKKPRIFHEIRKNVCTYTPHALTMEEPGTARENHVHAPGHWAPEQSALGLSFWLGVFPRVSPGLGEELELEAARGIEGLSSGSPSSAQAEGPAECSGLTLTVVATAFLVVCQQRLQPGLSPFFSPF